MSESTLSYPIVGDSMFPTFRHGDILLIDLKKLTEQENGDILLLKNKTMHDYTAHRVIDTLNQKIKGDLSISYDNQSFDEIEIIGSVVGRERNQLQLYWGLKGQPFKRVIALVSAYRVKSSFFRIISKIILYILVQVSFLFCSKSIKDHI